MIESNFNLKTNKNHKGTYEIRAQVFQVLVYRAGCKFILICLCDMYIIITTLFVDPLFS